MKKIFLSLISIVLVATCLWADQNSLAVQKLLYGRTSYSLEEQVSIEKYELQLIEEELAYLNNILALKTAINELYETGNIEKIKDGFWQRTEKLNELLKDDLLNKSLLSINEQKIIYEEIPVVQDQLLLNLARVAYQQDKQKLAQSYLEEIINSYQSSPVWQEAYDLLAKLYFEQQLNVELLELVENYNVERTDFLSFQYANALFNLGNYLQAKTEFEQLLESETLSLQSRCLLGLSAFFLDDVKAAINQLELILGEDDLPRQVKNFVLINLGRIYLLENPDEAWPYFNTYYENNSDIEDKILFEIAGYFFEAQKYESAKSILTEIINRTPKSKFYVSASFMLTITNFFPDDQVEAEKAVDSLMLANQGLLENLSSKFFFLDKYQKILEQIISIDSTDITYENLVYQLDLIGFELTEIDEQLASFYRGSADKKLAKLSFLEEEYKNYMSILADIRALILIAQQIPKENFSKYLSNQIAFTDSSLIILQVVKYLRAKPLITPQDYKLARSIAIEKILLQSDLNAWSSLEESAAQNQNFHLMEKIESYQNLLHSNIAGFDKIAEYVFGYSSSENYEQYLEYEIAAIKKNRTELFELRQNINESFDNLISRKLERENTTLKQEFEELKNSYNSMINIVKNDINLENKEYEYQLLDILFENSQNLDEQYLQLQQKMIDQGQEFEEGEDE